MKTTCVIVVKVIVYICIVLKVKNNPVANKFDATHFKVLIELQSYG